MKIFITGGTGLIGSRLVNSLLDKGYNVTVYTRNKEKGRQILGDKVYFVDTLNDNRIFDGYDAIINLAGESIAGGIWTEKRKKILTESRIKITQRLTEIIKNSENLPSVFISGSAIGYYGSQGDKMLVESSKPHDEFTYHLCEEWESSAEKANSKNTRVCFLRTGIVLSSKGGALPKMALPFRYGLGAVLGTGRQYISWIHIQDMVDGIICLLENNNARGAFNMTSPDPVTNRFFSQSIARALHRPCLFRIPRFVISLVMGEAATMLIDGQRAIPQKLETLGFKFKYIKIDDALKNILGQKR